MSISPGTRLGAYEVRELLGQGAMGAVYHAYHEALARDAAVKVLHALAPDPAAGDRFRREAQAIAQLRHPHILSVYDFGDHDGTPYMVVEYMPGGTLADLLRAGAVDPAQRLNLLRQVAAALDYAHSLGIVHRDVKPANVLVGRDGDAVLGDFGLAKLLQRASIQTQSGTATGTPAYMAPEQVMGRQVGPAADVYALATMAYELVTGSIPFAGEGTLEVLYAHVHRDPPAPSSVRPDVPSAVDAVLLKGLAKEPAERWPTCTEMIEALATSLGADPLPPTRPLLASTPTIALAPVGVAARAAGPAIRRSRWRLALTAAAALLLLLVLGTAGVAAYLNSPRPGLDVAADSVPAGETLDVSGHGFGNGKNITLYLGNGVLATTTSDESGDFTATVRIPRTASTGAHSLKACAGFTCATSSVAVSAPAVQPTPTPTPTPRPSSTPSPAPTPSPAINPHIVVSPTTAKVGGSVHVSGTGFPADGKVSIVLSGNGKNATLAENVAVAANGTVTTTGNVPSVPAGTYLVRACYTLASTMTCAETSLGVTN